MIKVIFACVICGAFAAIHQSAQRIHHMPVAPSMNNYLNYLILTNKNVAIGQLKRQHLRVRSVIRGEMLDIGTYITHCEKLDPSQKYIIGYQLDSNKSIQSITHTPVPITRKQERDILKMRRYLTGCTACETYPKVKRAKWPTKARKKVTITFSHERVQSPLNRLVVPVYSITGTGAEQIRTSSRRLRRGKTRVTLSIPKTLDESEPIVFNYFDGETVNCRIFNLYNNVLSLSRKKCPPKVCPEGFHESKIVKDIYGRKCISHGGKM